MYINWKLTEAQYNRMEMENLTLVKPPLQRQGTTVSGWQSNPPANPTITLEGTSISLFALFYMFAILTFQGPQHPVFLISANGPVLIQTMVFGCSHASFFLCILHSLLNSYFFSWSLSFLVSISRPALSLTFQTYMPSAFLQILLISFLLCPHCDDL